MERSSGVCGHWFEPGAVTRVDWGRLPLFAIVAFDEPEGDAVDADARGVLDAAEELGGDGVLELVVECGGEVEQAPVGGFEVGVVLDVGVVAVGGAARGARLGREASAEAGVAEGVEGVVDRREGHAFTGFDRLVMKLFSSDVTITSGKEEIAKRYSLSRRS